MSIDVVFANPKNNTVNIEHLKHALNDADTVIIGAGAGLSTAAGLTYSGERYEQHFADFENKYHFGDMYSGYFHHYPTTEEMWAFLSRLVYYNRYDIPPLKVYTDLFELVKSKDYFVLTTNVDHQFQNAGFDNNRLFYTQGDYGLWQCSKPCSQTTYDNEETIRKMLSQQKDMKIPSELLPKCPKCGAPLTMNLRADDKFVEDEGWHAASNRYHDFLKSHSDKKVLYLELGVGHNTPGIIKFPFWRFAQANPKATYACINLDESFGPKDLYDRCILIDGDIAEVLNQLVQ